MGQFSQRIKVHLLWMYCIKNHSNQNISISSRLLVFWAPCSSGGGGVGGWGCGVVQGASTHVHMHAHACTYTC